MLVVVAVAAWLWRPRTSACRRGVVLAEAAGAIRAGPFAGGGGRILADGRPPAAQLAAVAQNSWKSPRFASRRTAARAAAREEDPVRTIRSWTHRAAGKIGLVRRVLLLLLRKVASQWARSLVLHDGSHSQIIEKFGRRFNARDE
jgi:hypothetical protein